MAEVLVGGDEGSERTRSVPDDDIAKFSNFAITWSIEEEFASLNKPLPAYIAANNDRFAFELIRAGVRIFNLPGTKWPKYVSIRYSILADSTADYNVDAGIPAPEWVDGPISFEVNVALTFKRGIKFALAEASTGTGGTPPAPIVNPGGSAGIDTDIRIKVKFTPKIATITSVHEGDGGEWIFRHKPNEGLNGDWELLISVTRERSCEIKGIMIEEARVIYQRALFTDEAIIRDKFIPLRRQRTSEGLHETWFSSN